MILAWRILWNRYPSGTLRPKTACYTSTAEYAPFRIAWVPCSRSWPPSSGHTSSPELKNWPRPPGRVMTAPPMSWWSDDLAETTQSTWSIPWLEGSARETQERYLRTLSSWVPCLDENRYVHLIPKINYGSRNSYLCLIMKNCQIWHSFPSSIHNCKIFIRA